MIIVFAEPGDGLAADIQSRLTERGRGCLLITPPVPGCSFRFSWQIPPVATEQLVFSGRTLQLERLRGVVVRALPPSPAGPRGAESDLDYLRVEWSAALVGWLKTLPCPVLNRPRPGRSFHPAHLSAYELGFRAAGLRLPRLLVTNSEQEARRFWRSCGGTVLRAPWQGEPLPAESEDEAAQTDGGSCLLACPAGERRRLHVVGNEVFAERLGDDGGTASAEYLLTGILADRCSLLAGRLGLSCLQLTVVSGAGGDVVLAAADLPDAVFGDLSYRKRVAGALAKRFTEERPEALP